MLIPVLAQAQSNKTSFEIISHNKSEMIIDVQIPDYATRSVQTPRGMQEIILLDQGAQRLEAEAPNLPFLTFSLIIPNQANSSIEILNSSYKDVSNIEVAPSKGKIYRDQDPNNFPYIYGDAYQQNEYFPQQLASLQTPYILRAFRGQATHINPVQYNPVQKSLRVYNYMRLKISFTEGGGLNTLNRSEELPQQLNASFASIYENNFLNYKTLSTGYTPLIQEGAMLILSSANYLPALPEFIEWKERKGIKTYLVNVDTMSNGGPTESNLMNLVTDYYLNKEIVYLLIVGDNDDVKCQNATFTQPFLHGPSDIAYAFQAGNDHYPEFIVGRFSGDSLQHIETQVQRTLEYERASNTSTDWMKRQVGIASDQGPGDKGQFDHEHMRQLIDSNFNHFTYTNAGYDYEFYDGTQGGNDKPLNPQSADIVTAMNTGLGLINYTGHGTLDHFSTSVFSGIYDIPNLTNKNGDWPFIISVACLQGNFVYPNSAPCLAESLLRSRDMATDEPQGAIATMMSSILQSWEPPMHGQDEMNAILRGERAGDYSTAIGVIGISGCMSTNDVYNTNVDPEGGNEITDTWIFFGDPTVNMTTNASGALMVTHDAEIGMGSTWFAVNSSEEHALIGLYHQGEFLGSGIVQNGSASINFPAVLNLGDTVWITGTKQNFETYEGYAVVSNFPTSLTDLSSLGIQVYPNPASDYLIVSDNENRIESMKLIDQKGRVVLETSSTRMDVRTLSRGIYHLQLKVADRVLSTKVLLQ